MRWKTLISAYGVPHMSDTSHAEDHSQNQNNDQQQRQNNNQNQNNDQDNLDLNTNIWQNDNNGDKDKNTTVAPTAEELQKNFNGYIEGLNLSAEIDHVKLSEELRDGNFSGLQEVIKKSAQNTYRQAIMDTNRLVQAQISTAVEEAVRKATSQVRGSGIIAKMNEQLPFTAKPAIAPVATAILNQLVAKGKTGDQAIDGVKKLFAELHKTSAKDLGISTMPKRPGNSPFNNSAPQNDVNNPDDDFDWETLLTQ